MQRFRSLHEAPSNWRILLNTAYCLLLLMVVQVYFFGLYSQALRHQMGYSAFGNQYVYNFGLIGYALAMVFTGSLIDYGGIPLALSTACITSVAGFSIAALAVGKVFYCPEQLMWVIVFIAGLGQGIGHIAGVSTNIRNYSYKVRGTVSGITSASDAAAAVMFAQIWETFFVDDLSDYSPESMKLESFFWFLAVLYGCVYGIGAMVVKIWHVADPQFDGVPEEEEEGDLSKNLVYGTDTVNTGDTAPKSSFRDLLCPGYVALLLIYVNYKGIVLNYKGDIGKIGESLGLDDTVPNQLMAYGAVSAVTRLVVGATLDIFKNIPRWTWLEMMTGIHTLVCLANTFFLYTLFQTYLSTIIMATSSAIPPAMVAIIGTRFGTVNVANAWGTAIVTSNAGLFAYGAWSSIIYQNHVEPGHSVCEGVQCYQMSFVVAMIISAIIMTFFFIFREDATVPLKLRQTREQTAINVSSA